MEVNEKKDRVVDALNATRAAVEEGIVPGGGKALLYCSTKLAEVAATKAINLDQRIGVEIIERALRAPLKQIVDNAGEEGAVVVGELIKDDVPVERGYNAQTGDFRQNSQKHWQMFILVGKKIRILDSSTGTIIFEWLTYDGRRKFS